MTLKRIAHYDIEELLGEGAMAKVYRAVDENLGRAVALKIVAHSQSDAETHARFAREAKALARIDDPHVVRVYASGDDDGHSWMALELIEGLSLREHLKEGAFDEETAFSLGAQLALGLAAVHDVGVLHRDVKPDNLIIDDNGRLRIVDFGIAQMQREQDGFQTQAGIVVGTPHYMSPEQARGEVLDERVDTWAAGATLYTMLTGHPPFYRGIDNEPELDILSRVLGEDAPDVRDAREEISQTGARYLRLLLSRDKERRPANLREVATVFDALVEHGVGNFDDEVFTSSGAALKPHQVPAERSDLEAEQESSQASVAAATTKPKKPAPRFALAATLLLVSLFALVAFWAWREFSPAEAPPSAEVRPLPVKNEIPEVPAPQPEPEQKVPDAPTVSVEALFDSPDPAAQARLLERIQDNSKDALRLLELLSDERARTEGVHYLEAIVFGPHLELQSAAVERLSAARNLKALNVLRRAEKEHPRKSTRRLARKARTTIFSVE